MNNTYIRALTRYWWILVVGAAVALVAAVEMIASIKPGMPPKVKLRTPPTYTATQLLLVNSAANPYLRTSVTNVIPKSARTTLVKPKATGKSAPAPPPHIATVPQPPSISISQPNVQALVRAANFYPRLIESDMVLSVRNRMYGHLNGTITATALNSFQSPSRYRPSSFPIIQLTATAHRPKAAIALALATSSAFQRWLTDSQAASNVPAGQRILIDSLKRPTQAISTGGPKKGLPIFVGFAVLAAFAGIAIVVDRLRGKRAIAAVAVPTPAEAGGLVAAASAEPEEGQVEPFPTGVRMTNS